MMPNEKTKLFRSSIEIAGFTIFIFIFFVTSVLFLATPLTLNFLIQEGGLITIANILFI